MAGTLLRVPDAPPHGSEIRFACFARQIVLQGQELRTPEQNETVIPPHRRPVRH
jgi:hypothetical protein